MASSRAFAAFTDNTPKERMGMTWGLGTVLGPVSQPISISLIVCRAFWVHSDGLCRSSEARSLKAVSDGALLSTSTVSYSCLAFIRAST